MENRKYKSGNHIIFNAGKYKALAGVILSTIWCDPYCPPIYYVRPLSVFMDFRGLVFLVIMEEDILWNFDKN